MSDDIAAMLRLPDGPVDLADHDSRATPGYPDGLGKKDQPDLMADLASQLGDHQERLFAAGRTDPEQAPSLLLILQGLDTAGKGGVIRHAVGLFDPQGVSIKAFKAPTAEELSHDFLWRIEKALPAPGMIGIFDRSQYEDVLVVRVNELVPESEWRTRFDRINDFEARLVESGTKIVKCFLNVSYDKQGERLLERLDRPDKQWKFSDSDLPTRAKWSDFHVAYAEALQRCNTEHAPWYVIPADRKWYRNWAVTQLLANALQSLDLAWPAPDYDVGVAREQLLATM